MQRKVKSGITYNQLLQKLHILSLKLQKEKLLYDNMNYKNMVCSVQFDLIENIRTQITETLDQIKEMELDLE